MHPKAAKNALRTAVINALVTSLLHVCFPPYTRWHDARVRRDRARSIRIRVIRRVAPAVVAILLLELFHLWRAAKLDHPDEARQVLADKVEAMRARSYAALADELPGGWRSYWPPDPSRTVARERVKGPSGTEYSVHANLSWLEGPGGSIKVTVYASQVGTQAGIYDRFRVTPPTA